MQKKGSVVTARFESRVLKDNPPGDPYKRDVLVYLPPSYDDNSKTRFPVVYCLPGFTGTARSWFNFQAWIPAIDERMDLLTAGGMNQLILVFPDCFTRYGGSQYVDSAATGKYRTYLSHELIPFIDANFRSHSDRSRRAILGKSSGGYGAITIAMEHPDLFSAVACHSGDMYFEYCYLPEFPSAFRMLQTYGGLDGYLRRFDEIPKWRKEQHTLLNLVAMSAAYSPNASNAPHFFDLPFDQETGELLPDVWTRWKQCDPVDIAQAKGAALKDYRLVFIDCGKKDEFFLNVGARIFTRRLRDQGVPHEYEEFEDGHFNIQYRYDVSLQKIAACFAE